MTDPLRINPLPEGGDLPERERDARVEELLLAGLDHYFGGQHELAISVWTRVLFLDRGHARAKAYIDRAPTYGREWVAAGSSSDRVMRLTASELAQLGDEMWQVAEKWRAVGTQHVDGDGSEQVVVLQQAYRWPRV